ncbi:MULTISPECIES: sigma-70 family RNA polymerase sigma factor [Paenibacillus]|uniref:sigma-70 family RNA polymerase sigma factor n=1 Tax=Paenibacillus TaxID=44249 RepID=UPI0013E92531|nr:sigma-70 family RNA polymerase sigma factor [Paenibacillus sp. EKM211P]KAF6580612.1 sigma-70 family RNA polymerase sigma factor [Paenibacillus sp. EKM211P]MEE4562579.1 sigma-70 family RNA polymerase sigma factor [Paenibacillus polymyxa]
MDLTEKAELATQGDKEAFVNIIRAVQQSLYVVARSIIKNEEDCADAIQETIAKAFSNVHGLKEPAYFKTWIIRILINECNRIIRKKKRVFLVPYDLRKTSYKGDYEQIELFEVIVGLDEQLQTTVTLFYIEDLSVKDISKVLNVSEGTVKSRLFRARQQLSKLALGGGEAKYELS